eukprot:10696989-Lingulodinium_polyedra.AAC.1
MCTYAGTCYYTPHARALALANQSPFWLGPATATAHHANLMSRPRFTGSGTDIAAVLKPLAEERGKSWLRYDEALVVSKAKIDKIAIKNALPI